MPRPAVVYLLLAISILFAISTFLFHLTSHQKASSFPSSQFPRVSSSVAPSPASLPPSPPASPPTFPPSNPTPELSATASLGLSPRPIMGQPREEIRAREQRRKRREKRKRGRKRRAKRTSRASSEIVIARVRPQRGKFL